MFDWDDQELVDILWAGAEDTSDHIVPFPRGCEELPADVPGDLIKTPQNEEIANGKMSKQKKPVSSSELDGVKQEISFEFDNNKILSVDGDSVDSWSKSLAKVSKNSRADKPTKQDGGSQILQDLSDDKESDLVGYDWHTIGSFEDLDRMFSIGDTEFGCTSLENTDELWPCSMDYSSFASGAPSTSDQCGKTEDMLDQDQPCSLGYSNMNDLTRCFPQKKLAEFKNHPFGDNKIDRDMVSKTLQVDSDFSTGKVSVPTEFSDKVDRQKYILRRRKRSGEDSKARPYQDLPKTWFSSENQFLQLEDHHAKTGQSPAFKGINRQIKFPETASSPYNKFTTALFSPSGHTHVHIQDPFTPILPQFHSSSKVPSGRSKTLNKFPASSANPLTMTPEEKIKKLRRRQQLRAMLAIQKQQKQFGHDTSESQQSIYQKYTIPDQLQLAGGNLEVDVSTLNMNSPAEQDYSGTMSLASDDCCPESAILYRLQNIVAKLDVQLRLCIRDSLCRLAQSATQRQHAKDTGSAMKQSGNYLNSLSEEGTNSDNRYARTPEGETDTNPIDRTVAHLLFHRPIELSENLETAESPRSAKMLQERTSTC
ncbi:protein LNK2 isoform X1 [Daucus carota subsp. sativus]|uniref:protein LNK2 isoform X1 n=1 Tax=Daucus carota subsp. sativus TaxID=79200 RepID=UPI0030828171